MLELEITETAMMANPESTRALVDRLRAFGFRISIDDFGTGYSSLTYLQTFRVDRLKLDRSFLTDASKEVESSDGIIQSVLSLARHLNTEVVAEGVETLTQLERLREMACDFAQGYYFLRPVEPEPIDRLMLRRPAAGSTGSPGGDGPASVEPDRRSA
jgi:EAL domain-containing protein (putative c-di-GMP-specific phosphodiesterase class I)